MSIYINKLYGVVDDETKALKRAKDADLITLPQNIEGTNCYNCKYVHDTKTEVSICNKPEVNQYVNSRMCCIFWSHSGEYRAFEGKTRRLD